MPATELVEGVSTTSIHAADPTWSSSGRVCPEKGRLTVAMPVDPGSALTVPFAHEGLRRAGTCTVTKR